MDTQNMATFYPNPNLPRQRRVTQRARLVRNPLAPHRLELKGAACEEVRGQQGRKLDRHSGRVRPEPGGGTASMPTPRPSQPLLRQGTLNSGSPNADHSSTSMNGGTYRWPGWKVQLPDTQSNFVSCFRINRAVELARSMVRGGTLRRDAFSYERAAPPRLKLGAWTETLDERPLVRITRIFRQRPSDPTLTDLSPESVDKFSCLCGFRTLSPARFSYPGQQASATRAKLSVPDPSGSR